MDSFGKEQRGAGMSKIVEPRRERKIRPFEQGLPGAVVQIMRADGGANTRAKDPFAGPGVILQGHERGPRKLDAPPALRARCKTCSRERMLRCWSWEKNW